MRRGRADGLAFSPSNGRDVSRRTTCRSAPDTGYRDETCTLMVLRPFRVVIVDSERVPVTMRQEVAEVTRDVSRRLYRVELWHFVVGTFVWVA